VTEIPEQCQCFLFPENRRTCRRGRPEDVQHAGHAAPYLLHAAIGEERGDRSRDLDITRLAEGMDESQRVAVEIAGIIILSEMIETGFQSDGVDGGSPCSSYRRDSDWKCTTTHALLSTYPEYALARPVVRAYLSYLFRDNKDTDCILIDREPR